MPPGRTWQQCLDFLMLMGSYFISAVSKTGEPHDGKRGLVNTDKVTCGCAGCGEPKTGVWSMFLNSKSPQLLCRACARRGTHYKRDKNDLEQFKKSLGSAGWKLVSPDSDFVSADTPMELECSKFHSNTKTLKEWERRPRCEQCVKPLKKNLTIEEIARRVALAGMELLTTVYDPVSREVMCRCKCGLVVKIHASNIDENMKGCAACARSVTIEKATLEVEKDGCKVLYFRHRTGRNPKLVINETTLGYLCHCEDESQYETSMRCFRDGARCPKCTQRKREATNMEFLGVKNVGEDPAVKAKIAATESQYPEGHHSRDVFIKANMQAASIAGNGGIHPFKDPKIRQAAASARSQIREYISPSGAKYYLQGVEDICLALMLREGLPIYGQIDETQIRHIKDKSGGEKQLPKVNYEFEGKLRSYQGDFFIPHLNLWIEVKDPHSYAEMCTNKDSHNEQKLFAASKKYVVWVMVYKRRKHVKDRASGHLVSVFVYSTKSKLVFQK